MGVMLRDTGVQDLVPAERWDADALYSSAAQQTKSYARFAAFVEVRGAGCAN